MSARQDGRARAGQRLRVLHVITRLDRGGSADNTLLTVARHERSRFEITLATGPTAEHSSMESRVLADVEVHGIRHLVRRVNPIQDLRCCVARPVT